MKSQYYKLQYDIKQLDIKRTTIKIQRILTRNHTKIVHRSHSLLEPFKKHSIITLTHSNATPFKPKNRKTNFKISIDRFT